MASYDGEANYGGLGYSPGQTNETSSNSNSAGGMIQNLMQQCLAYHEQQKQCSVDPNQSFVPSTITTDTPAATGEPKESINIPKPIDQAVADARSRATAILQKFEQLNRDHSTETASEFRRKREQCLEQEQQRKARYWIKNFEFVSQRETMRLQQQMASLEQAKQFEAQMQEQYREALEQRKKRLLGNNKQQDFSTQAGIGTSKRRRVEKDKSRSGHLPSQQQDSSVAVYLSGLPEDGSVSEDMLQALFGSYGSIRKIHMYRNKQTGELKGDALVIYQTEKGVQKNELLQTVCSQMNGAELPSGSVLQVEPADSGYSQKTTASTYGPAAALEEGTKKEEAVAEPAEENDDEDLDDFFESLE